MHLLLPQGLIGQASLRGPAISTPRCCWVPSMRSVTTATRVVAKAHSKSVLAMAARRMAASCAVGANRWVGVCHYVWQLHFGRTQRSITHRLCHARVPGWRTTACKPLDRRHCMRCPTPRDPGFAFWICGLGSTGCEWIAQWHGMGDDAA
jgi:hypothetical protein